MFSQKPLRDLHKSHILQGIFHWSQAYTKNFLAAYFSNFVQASSNNYFGVGSQYQK
jgi:hypothetical protein